MSSAAVLPNTYLFTGAAQVLDHAHAGVAEALEVVRALCRECPVDELHAVRFYGLAHGSMLAKDMCEGIVAALLHAPVKVIARLGVDWSECYPNCPKAGRDPMTDTEIIQHFVGRMRSGEMRLLPKPLLQRQGRVSATG